MCSFRRMTDYGLSRPCPVWVTSGHGERSARCLLYPRKQTWGCSGHRRADCVRFVGAGRLDLVADGVGEEPSRQPRSKKLVRSAV